MANLIINSIRYTFIMVINVCWYCRRSFLLSHLSWLIFKTKIKYQKQQDLSVHSDDDSHAKCMQTHATMVVQYGVPHTHTQINCAHSSVVDVLRIKKFGATEIYIFLLRTTIFLTEATHIHIIHSAYSGAVYSRYMCLIELCTQE